MLKVVKKFLISKTAFKTLEKYPN